MIAEIVAVGLLFLLMVVDVGYEWNVRIQISIFLLSLIGAVSVVDRWSMRREIESNRDEIKSLKAQVEALTAQSTSETSDSG